MTRIVETNLPVTVITTDENKSTTVELFTGNKGPKGDPGIAGPKGDPGFSVAWGSFHNANSQLNSLPINVRSVLFNQTTTSNNCLIVDGSKITVLESGVYNLQFSIMFLKSDGGTDFVDLWLSVNGQNVNDSNTRITMVGNNTVQVAAWNFLIDMEENDFAELKWYSADPAIQIYALPSQTTPDRPATPSVIATISKIGPRGN